MTRKIQEVDYKIAAWLILDWAGEGRGHTGIQNGRDWPRVVMMASDSGKALC